MSFCSLNSDESMRSRDNKAPLLPFWTPAVWKSLGGKETLWYPTRSVFRCWKLSFPELPWGSPFCMSTCPLLGRARGMCSAGDVCLGGWSGPGRRALCLPPWCLDTSALHVPRGTPPPPSAPQLFFLGGKQLQQHCVEEHAWLWEGKELAWGQAPITAKQQPGVRLVRHHLLSMGWACSQGRLHGGGESKKVHWASS